MKPMPQDLLVALDELLNDGVVIADSDSPETMEDEVENAMKALAW